MIFGGSDDGFTFTGNGFKRSFIATLDTRVLPITLAGDYNGKGTVDAVDYTTWADNFGDIAGRGLTATLTIPEPSSLAWLVIGAWLMVGRRR